MAGQTQQPLATSGLAVLGVVGLIGDQHGAGEGQGIGQPSPAVQLQAQTEARRLSLPMVMQANWGNHHDAAVGLAHHGPSRNQGRERLTQPHGIRQDRAAAGQQPAHRGALMGE